MPINHTDVATGTANMRRVPPACTRKTAHPVPKAPTLADRMGVTVHESPLRFKIRRLMRLYRAPASCSIEDWLIELANRRGARVVFRPDSMPPTVRFPGSEELTEEELVVALCQMNCLDRPQMLRLAAQMISRNECDSGKLLRLMRMERATRVFKQLAKQALKVDSAHPAWLALQNALRNERELSQPLLHWTRLAEPLFAPRTANPIGWKLVS